MATSSPTIASLLGVMARPMPHSCARKVRTQAALPAGAASDDTGGRRAEMLRATREDEVRAHGEQVRQAHVLGRAIDESRHTTVVGRGDRHGKNDGSATRQARRHQQQAGVIVTGRHRRAVAVPRS